MLWALWGCKDTYDFISILKEFKVCGVKRRRNEIRVYMETKGKK